jgi:hypothetical protein
MKLRSVEGVFFLSLSANSTNKLTTFSKPPHNPRDSSVTAEEIRLRAQSAYFQAVFIMHLSITLIKTNEPRFHG